MPPFLEIAKGQHTESLSVGSWLGPQEADKVKVNARKMKILKMTKEHFHWAVYRKKFMWLPFATALLLIAHIAHINQNKYLILLKLENISQTKCILDKFCWKNKRTPILGWMDPETSNLGWMDPETSNFQLRFHLKVAFRNWYLSFYWYFSLSLIRVILVKTSKT